MALAAAGVLGTKHTCSECNSRFFDLGKKPAACPKCGTEQKVVLRSNVRRVRKASTRVLDGGDLLMQHMKANKLPVEDTEEEEEEKPEAEADEDEE